MSAPPRILVTRSQPGAGRLGKAIRQAGFDARVLPLIGVQPHQDGAYSRVEETLQEFDIVLCLSSHSVAFASDLLKTLKSKQNRGPILMAIGRATRSSLEELGLDVTDNFTMEGSGEAAVSPESSEALLATSSLAQPENSRILIISGVGGRTLLADTLQQRGAEVVTLSVYQRIILSWSKAQALEASTSDGVILSSGEAVTAFNLRWPGDVSSRKIVLIVPNERVRLIAQDSGFSRVLSSEGPGDDAVISKLKQVFNE